MFLFCRMYALPPLRERTRQAVVKGLPLTNDSKPSVVARFRQLVETDASLVVSHASKGTGWEDWKTLPWEDHIVHAHADTKAVQPKLIQEQIFTTPDWDQLNDDVLPSLLEKVMIEKDKDQTLLTHLYIRETIAEDAFNNSYVSGPGNAGPGSVYQYYDDWDSEINLHAKGAYEFSQVRNSPLTVIAEDHTQNGLKGVQLGLLGKKKRCNHVSTYTYDELLNLQTPGVYTDPKGATKVPKSAGSSAPSTLQSYKLWDSQVLDNYTLPAHVCTMITLPPGTLIPWQPSLTHDGTKYQFTPTVGADMTGRTPVKYTTSTNGKYFRFQRMLSISVQQTTPLLKYWGDYTSDGNKAFSARVVKRLIRNDDVIHWRVYAADIKSIPDPVKDYEAFVRPQVEYFIVKKTGQNVMVFIDQQNHGYPYYEKKFSYPNCLALAARVVKIEQVVDSPNRLVPLKFVAEAGSEYMLLTDKSDTDRTIAVSSLEDQTPIDLEHYALM